MADVHTFEQRRRNMSAIKGKDTKPEMIVRRLAHSLGYRYRLHRGDLPGRPDLVFSSRKKVVFVHGCYWHMHDCRYGRVVPATRTEFWQAKRKSNVERDLRNQDALRRAGWSYLVIWECNTKDGRELADDLTRFLDDPATTLPD